MDLIISSSLVIPSNDLRWSFSRSSGPGGQNVNKVESRVTLLFDLDNSNTFTAEQKIIVKKGLNKYLQNGCIRLIASDYRNQYQNRKLALLRLRTLLLVALGSVKKERKRTKPTISSQRKRVHLKKHRGKIKRIRQDKAFLDE